MKFFKFDIFPEIISLKYQKPENSSPTLSDKCENESQLKVQLITVLTVKEKKNKRHSITIQNRKRFLKCYLLVNEEQTNFLKENKMS